MSFSHVVVDGSNIATEGRSTPSLAQLDEAVREFRAEYPDAEITVVVDATFGHRIDDSERPAFDEAQAHGEVVSPPAGAIGRGDAFLLRIADRSGATVLSNDSFQEFHGEYEWLFTKGRLIGGKPVPGVGWIFTPRNPVRGPKSRESMREARRTRVRIGSKEASRPMPVPKAPPPRPSSGRGKSAVSPVSDAIAAATEEAVSPKPTGGSRRRRRRGGGPPAEAVNDPLTFIQFIAEHPLGGEVEGEVESFASHGAFVVVGGARCYIPLSAMGDPPPRAAREILERGARLNFVLQALDAQRRGIELALPGFEHVSGRPQQETVEAEIAVTSGKKSAAETSSADELSTARSTSRKSTSRKSTSGKAAAKKTPAKKAAAKATAAKSAIRKTTGNAAVEKAVTRATRAATAKKTTTTAKKSAATEKAAPEIVPARKAAPAKKSSTAKKAAPAEKAAPARKAAVAKKAAPAKKASTAKSAATKKSAATTAAEKAPAKRAGVKKTAAKKSASSD